PRSRRRWSRPRWPAPWRLILRRRSVAARMRASARMAQRTPDDEEGESAAPLSDWTRSGVIGAPITARAEAGFTPGTILAGRYRVAALLGRGGMGEVYRADDVKLGQPVALKFVRGTLSADVLARLYAEVRIGRQVSHPSVCRLYDIVEVDGQT